MIVLRRENAGDREKIHVLTDEAFRNAPHSGGTEPRIVDALREAGALTLSIVAVADDDIVGHVAFSPVEIDGKASNWYGLGPVSVHPSWQRRGIGSSLVKEGLRQQLAMGAGGCVLLGDPAFYGRFGFLHEPRLIYHGAPAAYFLALALQDTVPAGEVRYHRAFSVT